MGYKYAYAFKEADENRKNLGLPSIYSKFKWKNTSTLTDKQSIVESELQQFANDPIFQGVSCLTFHYEYLKFIQENIDPLATLTVGYIEHKNLFLFKFPFKNIKKWYNDGILSTENRWKLNLHVWITLSNLEIIDLTLPFAISQIKQQTLNYYPFLFGSPENNSIKTIYYPVIIGNDYVEKLYLSLFNSSQIKIYNPKKDYPSNREEFEILMNEIDNEFENQKVPLTARPLQVGMLLGKWLGYSGNAFPSIDLEKNDIYTGDSLRAKTYKWYDDMYGDKLNIDFVVSVVPIKVKNLYFELEIPTIMGHVDFFIDKHLKNNGNNMDSINVLNCIKNIKQQFIDNISEEDLFKIGNTAIEIIYAVTWFKFIIKKYNNIDLFQISLNEYNSSTINFFQNNLSQSAWSSQQCVEKIIKAILTYGSFSYPKGKDGHDLIKLKDKLKIDTNIILTTELDKTNYSPNVRYGEVPVDVESVYDANNCFVSVIIELYKNYTVKNYFK